MIVKVQAPHATEGRYSMVNLRCPACRQLGTFEGLFSSSSDVAIGDGLIVGMRCCPNVECRALVFFVGRNVRTGPGTPITTELLATYPPERLDFDASNLPPGVLKAIDEAVTCHAHECYIAAAIMIRKALEELCHDREATGDNLYQRIESLSGKVVLPRELLEGLQDLRILGNDAAHIESRVFQEVGKDEVELALDVTKLVLQAVYQYSAVIDRLRARKQNP
jgi:hypothetical protein